MAAAGAGAGGGVVRGGSGGLAAFAADDATLLYHEKQQASLCGRHALNNLVQGPVFDEFALAQIAQELDESETALMMADGHGDSVETLRFLAEGSHNVDDSGNFSISVLREALSRTFGLGIDGDSRLIGASPPVSRSRVRAAGGRAAPPPRARPQPRRWTIRSRTTRTCSTWIRTGSPFGGWRRRWARRGSTSTA